MKSLNELNKTTVETAHYQLKEKDIVYIPMHHLGKAAFYEDVNKSVHKYKSEGYRVYYELVSTNFTADSLLRDSIRRKARKLKGFNGTYKDQAGDNFKNYVQQPSYEDLGTDTTDLRADVNYLQLINQWEAVNGKIVLDSADFNVSFDQQFNKGTFYTKKEYEKIFITYRNSYLLDLIKSNADKKILVLYGAGHAKDFANQIKAK